MVKNVDSTSSDEEEFQFSDAEEHQHSSTDHNVSSSSVASSLGTEESAQKKKKILLLIGLIAAAFCIYKLYGLFMTTSARSIKTPLASVKFDEAKPTEPSDSVKQVNSQPLAAKVVAKTDTNEKNTEQKSIAKLPDFSSSAPPAENAESNLSQKPLVLESAKEGNTSTSQISAIDTQKVSSLEKSQENLQTQISGLSSAINEIQNNISMLTQQVNRLVTEKNTPAKEADTAVKQKEGNTSTSKEGEKKTQEAGAWNASHASVKSHYHPRSSFKTKSANSSGPMRTYYVRSMIQNRAWLVWGQDNTLTISPGDFLPGYGKILSIDTDEGLVNTSSGKVISYMSQDR